MELWLSQGADGRTVLHVSGEIDTAVADQLRDAGLKSVGADPGGLAIDLSQVTFIDSSGIAALIAINNDRQPPAPGLTLLNPSQPVRRILEITGLTPAFNIGGQLGPPTHAD